MTRPRRPTRLQVASATVVRPDQMYQLVRYRQQIIDPVTGFITFPPWPVKRVEASGDHLSVVEINGSHPIFCKMGSYRNPWVRLNARTSYKRAFRTLWFTLGDNISGGGYVNLATYVEAICYTSVGPLVDFTPMVPGIKRAFIANTIAVPASPADVDVMALMTSQPNFRNNTSGIEGGWLMIRNDGAFPVEIKYGASATGGYWLLGISPDPSSVMSVPLVGPIHEWVNPTTIPVSTIMARGVGGVGSLRVLLSPFEQDMSIPEQTPNLALGG